MTFPRLESSRARIWTRVDWFQRQPQIPTFTSQQLGKGNFLLLWVLIIDNVEAEITARQIPVCWHLSGCRWRTPGAGGAAGVGAHLADKGQGIHSSHSSSLSLLFVSLIFLLGACPHSECYWENDSCVPTEASPPSSGSEFSRNWAPHRHTDTENLEALDGISQYPRHEQDHISYHQGCHQPQ